MSNVIEDVNWFQCNSVFNFTLDEMLQWPVENIPDHDIEKQNHFCDSQLLSNVIEAKVLKNINIYKGFYN